MRRKIQVILQQNFSIRSLHGTPQALVRNNNTLLFM